MEYRNSAKDLTATAKSLSDSMAEVNSTRAEVDQAIADAKAGISGAKSDYDSTFSVKRKGAQEDGFRHPGLAGWHLGRSG